MCLGARKNVVCCGDACSIGRCATHVHLFCFLSILALRYARHFFRRPTNIARKGIPRFRSQEHTKTSLARASQDIAATPSYDLLAFLFLLLFRFLIKFHDFSTFIFEYFCAHFRLFVFFLIFLFVETSWGLRA